MSVDLPDPEGLMVATIAPVLTVTTSTSACTSSSPAS